MWKPTAFFIALSWALAAWGSAQTEIFHFGFEEGSGNRSRASSDLQGSFTADWGAGWSGYGLLLDGTGTKIVSLQLPPEKRIGTKSFTLSCRIQPTDLTVAGTDKRRRFLSLEDAWPVSWAVFDLTGEGKPRFECGVEKKGFSIQAKSAVPMGTWTHLALVFDREAGKISWFINGVLDSVKDLGDFKGLALKGDKVLTLGSGFQNLTGTLDEVVLREGALPADAITAEAKILPPVAPRTPKNPAKSKGTEPQTRGDNLKPSPVYYVGVDGVDGNTGIRRDEKGPEGPFASLWGAFGMIRGLKAKGLLKGPVTILVKPGTYFLKDTLVLTPDDSGSESAPITVKAEVPGSVILSGGVPVSNWKRVGSVYQATLPGVAEGDYFPTGLFIGENRAVRSRYPNKGYLRADAYVKESKDRFIYRAGDVKDWDHVDDITMTVYHAWTASVHTLDRVDTGKREIIAQIPSSYVFGKWGIARYYLENSLDFLDESGEWHMGKKTGVLTYKPRAGEDLEKAIAIVTRLPRLLDFRGNPKGDAHVSHLKFEGLSFQHVNSDFGPTEVIDGQAFANVRRAAVFAEGLAHSAFEGCTISHGQVHGIWFEKGCSDVTIRKSHIWDLGGGGVYIGDTKLHDNERLATHHITVENNYMHRLNLVMHGSHGIWIGKGTYNTLTHNEISDLDYSPIGVGWTWGFAEPSGAHHNTITYNHLHHFGLGELSDMAGIYTLGVSPGTVVRFNHVHDASAYSYGGWGLYTDEGSTEVLMEKNLVYNTKSGGFHQHYGSNNLIRNNIFAFSGEANVISKRGDEKNRSLRFERNIVLTTNGYAVNIGFKTPAFSMERNLYWDLGDASSNAYSFNGLSFSEWREISGYDSGSKVSDPMFRDPLKFDFSFRDPGPAKSIGFEPFLEEIAKAGLVGEPAWTGIPAGFSARGENPDREPPAPKMPVGSRWKLTEDFETVAPGVPTGIGSSDPGVLVTAEKAFRSTHSLKFQDEVGLSTPWKPHLAINRSFGNGKLSIDFDVYLEEGVRLWLEARDKAGSPYSVGPTFEILEDGTLKVAGGDKKNLPVNGWIHISISTETGASTGPSSWKMVFTPEKAEAILLENLPFGNPAWKNLDSLIFSANGEKKAAFYIDNLKVEVKAK